jgi:hypothetical protein
MKTRMALMGLIAVTGTGICQTQTNLEARANAGDAKAMAELGNELLRSKEPSDALRAEYYLRGASNAGYTNSMMELAHVLENRNATIDRIEESIKWYCAAGQRGVSAGYYAAGSLLENAALRPRTREQLDRETVDCYTKAAWMGNRQAICRMASFYKEGKRVPKDEDKAMAWFESGGGYAEVALIKEKRQDLVEAYKFWKLESYMRHEVSAYLGDLARRLTPQQLADGDERYRQYVAARRLKPVNNEKDIFTERRF